MREVGALLDARAVHGGRSAYNHLLCLAQTNDLPARRVGEVLELTGLSEVARKRTKGFSLGMGQRLGIAAALLGDPRVLMFDEPVNGLDPEGILWIRNLMKALAAEGRTIFVSSHLMSEMENTADHLIVIGRGRLISDCTVAEFIEQNSRQTVRVRTPDQGPLSTVLAAGGASVRDDGDGSRVALIRGAVEEHDGDACFIRRANGGDACLGVLGHQDDAIDFAGDEVLHLLELAIRVLVGDRFEHIDVALGQLGFDRLETSDPVFGLQGFKCHAHRELASGIRRLVAAGEDERDEEQEENGDSHGGAD